MLLRRPLRSDDRSPSKQEPSPMAGTRCCCCGELCHRRGRKLHDSASCPGLCEAHSPPNCFAQYNPNTQYAGPETPRLSEGPVIILNNRFRTGRYSRNPDFVACSIVRQYPRETRDGLHLLPHREATSSRAVPSTRFQHPRRESAWTETLRRWNNPPPWYWQRGSHIVLGRPMMVLRRRLHHMRSQGSIIHVQLSRSDYTWLTDSLSLRARSRYEDFWARMAAHSGSSLAAASRNYVESGSTWQPSTAPAVAQFENFWARIATQYENLWTSIAARYGSSLAADWRRYLESRSTGQSRASPNR